MDIIKLWLKKEDRSGSWLARQCDVSPATVHYWLQGKHKPSLKHKEAICQATGIEL